MIQRAVRRGELPPETDVPLLLESLIGPLYLRLLVTGEELSEEFAVQVVDLILDGVSRRSEGPLLSRPGGR